VSTLRTFLRTELGFPNNVITSQDGFYYLNVPVLVEICTDKKLGFAFT